MINKKFLASVLALSMLLPFTVSAFADNVISGEYEYNEAEEKAPEVKAEQAVKAKPVSDEVKALVSSIGILDEAEMAMNSFIDRAFAAEVVMRMTGLDTDKSASGNVYNDVDDETQYGYSIEAATDMGYFSGTGGGSFSPEANITDRQMATILMRFAGYDGKISLDSVYSKLTKNVNVSDDLTYSDLANMLYNFLDLGTINLDGVSASGMKYSINDDNTILNDWFSVYIISGIVTENGNTGLYAASTVREDEVLVSTSKGVATVKVGDTKIGEEIGKYVDVYYKADNADDDKICVGYYVSESRNEITELSLNDINASSSTANRLIYYKDGREKKLRYESGVAVIYNGYYYSDAGFSLMLLDDKEGIFTAIDNNGDGSVDVFNISAFEVKMVKSVVLSTNTINFTDGTSITVDEDNFDEYSIVYADGIKAYLEDFDEYTAVSYATTCSTATKKIARVIVSTGTVTGIISGIDADDAGHTVVTLESGETYRTFDTAFIGVGKSVEMYITKYGNIAKISVSVSGDFKFGILAKVKYDRKGGNLEIRILNSENKHEDAKVTEKLRIDGISCRNYAQMFNMLAGDNAPNKYDIGIEAFAEIHSYPIRYRYRQDGTLLEIDTPKRSSAEDADTLQWIGYASALGVKQGFMNNYVLGFETPIRPSTLFFKVSAAEEQYVDSGWSYKWTEEAFNNTTYTSVDKASSLASSYATRNINYSAYKCSSDDDTADLVVTISGPSTSTNTTPLFMFDRSVAAYDDERGETVKKLIGYLGGVKTEVTVMPEYSDSINPSQGDVITFGTDSLGRLSRAYYIIKKTGTDTMDIQTVKDANTNDNFNRIRTGDQRKLASSMIFGYVLKRKNDLILIKNIPYGSVTIDRTAITASTNPPSTEEAWIRIPPSTPVVVYDPAKTDPVYAGTYDEILDGSTTKSVIGIRYGSNTTIQEIVVLN